MIQIAAGELPGTIFRTHEDGWPDRAVPGDQPAEPAERCDAWLYVVDAEGAGDGALGIDKGPLCVDHNEGRVRPAFTSYSFRDAWCSPPECGAHTRPAARQVGGGIHWADSHTTVPLYDLVVDVNGISECLVVFRVVA